MVEVTVPSLLSNINFLTIDNPPSFSTEEISFKNTIIDFQGNNISDKFGQVTLLTGGTVSIADAQIQSTSIIILTPIGSGIGLLSVNNYTGIGFVISSSDITDTRTINYMIHY